MKFALVTIATLFAAANAAHPLSEFSSKEIYDMAMELHEKGLPEGESNPVIEAMVELTGYGQDTGARRLGGSSSGSKMNYGNSVVERAADIAAEGYSGACGHGSDQAKVKSSGGRCYVTFRESNDIGDWIENFNLGNEHMLNRCSTQRKCSWVRKGWKFKYKCRNENVCEGRSGYDGFVGPYKGLRNCVANKIRSTCGNSQRRVYVGYSRGGGLAQIAAYMDIFEGKTSGSTAELVTFGSPRALPDRESDELHNVIGSRGHRACYGADPVCGVPYAWMGYKHVGGRQYGSINGRDAAPWFQPWKMGDHTCCYI